MDDAKIDLIAREVLTSLKKSRAQGATQAPVSPRAQPEASPSGVPFHLQLLSVSGGAVGSPCVIEPDTICDGSARCRSFGH